MSIFQYISLDRQILELRRVIYAFGVEGGPITEKRIQQFCEINFNLPYEHTSFLINEAVMKRIIKYVKETKSYELSPTDPFLKSTRKRSKSF